MQINSQNMNELYKVGKAECKLGKRNHDTIISFDTGLDINEDDIKEGYYNIQ